MKKKLENIFSKPDVYECSKKCRDSLDCVAYLITLDDVVSDAKGTQTECSLYSKNCKIPNETRHDLPRRIKRSSKFNS